MEQRVWGTWRLWVAALAVLSMAWVLVPGAPADAFGSSEPPPIPSVNAGGYMTCGIQPDGTAACWGADEAPADANTAPGMATPPQGVTFQVVNAGYGTACGVTTDEDVVCWGNDRFDKVTGVPEGSYRHVVVGLNYACALRTDDTIACWGGDDPAAPGADPDQLVVADVPDGQFTQLTMGIRHACALDAAGAITCWGFNADGQIDVPEGTYRYVNAGNFTTCALRTDGTAVCWGRNDGQHTVPEGSFTMISAGFAHVCALDGDDAITCWGRNDEGQATPPVGPFTDVSTGTFHSCAMPASGAPAVCWGNNQAGRAQPSMSAGAPPLGIVGTPYSHQLEMETHVSPAVSFDQTSGDLPPGVTLDEQGLLSGTPTTAGTFTFGVNATNGLSPSDCVAGATGSLPCDPGDPDSVATATRVFTIQVGEGEPGAIAGTVTDADGGAPIEGATVTAAVDSSPAGQATTAADGTYEIGNLVPGDYTVAVSADGYVTPDAQAATVESGATTTVDVGLVAEEPVEGPTVVGVWNNHVNTLTDGLFIEWSEEIRAQPANEEIGAAGYTVHPDPDCSDAAIANGEDALWTGGQPTIRDLVLHHPENLVYGETYYLRVAADTELGTESGVSNDLVPCFEFVAELREQDNSTFAGTVTDAASGEAIAGATVTVNRTVGDPGSVAGEATTAADGTYAISDLPPGPYELTADAVAYEPATQGETAVGGDTVTVDFELQPSVVDPGAIAGTVTDADTGAGIADATVTATDAEGEESSATTGGDGTYEIGGLAAGDYSVTASADGYLDPDAQDATVEANETTTVDFGLQPDPAVARCGEVVTADLVLDEDIGPCPDYGLIVDADDITLDLGGHTVFGTGQKGDGTGVLVNGRTGVTVRNGTIHSFDGGVAVDGGSGNHLEDLLIRDNIGSPATVWGEGVAFWESDGNTVCNSVIRNSGPYGGVGVYGSGTTGNVVGDPSCGEGSLDGLDATGTGGNLIVDNNAEFTAQVNQNYGVRLSRFTNSTRVENNVVAGNGLDGVGIFSTSTDNTVVGNVAEGNGAHDKLHRFGSGIISFAGSARNVIDDNISTGNAANGIVLRGPEPQLGVPGSLDNRVRDNVAVGNATMQDVAPGAPFADLHDANFEPPCDNNEWDGNVYGTLFQGCEGEGGTEVPAITGQVSDAETGAAIAGATVTAVHADGAETSTTTDADGNYTLEALATGAYTVTAAADGYLDASAAGDVGENELVTLDLALDPDAATKADCMRGGWRDFGFRNQGLCIQFVNTGKDSRT